MKFAICQELYENTSWGEQCRLIAEAGYTGIEVAPFTIGPDLAAVPDSQLLEMRATAAGHGLEIIGLHWLLARTTGFYLTHPDAGVRAATAMYLQRLARVNRLLGGTVMVFGSPQQRSLLPGVTRTQAVDFAVEVFASITAVLDGEGGVLCLEPLTTRETDFVNTCDDAMDIIRRVDHPTIQLHQDVKAMLGAERESIPDLIHRHKNFCRHFHVNDSNLLGPGMGTTDFHPILRALLDARYTGWVSVEVFDYSPGAQHIAVTSLQYMKSVLSDLSADS
jgi:sugar phosphate isomerase/epimerase